MAKKAIKRKAALTKPSAKKTHAKKATKKVAKKATSIRKKPTVKAKDPSTVKRTSARKDTKVIGGEAKSMVGQAAPSIILPATGGQNLSLADFKGRRVVLYFYPKDNTPGCTLEGYDFKRLERDFSSADTVILGVSKDRMKAHEGFKSKCGFPFELLSDEEEKLCRAFDVIQMKSLYGRKFLGIERSTFVIDRDGKVVREWRKVKVNGHAEEVLDYVRTL